MTRRRLAINRGLEFIYRTACDSENFEAYGFDYLGCFHGIAATSKDTELRRTERAMGRLRARVWRRQNSSIPRHLEIAKAPAKTTNITPKCAQKFTTCALGPSASARAFNTRRCS